jgi:hypothetical protein
VKLFSQEEFDLLYLSVMQTRNCFIVHSELFDNIIEKLDYCEKMGCKLVVLSDYEILNLN